MGLDRAPGKPAERDRLAAGADRLGDGAELVCDEDDVRILRRLFEVLEQRIGGVLVHQMGSDDEVDAAVGLEGAHVQVAAELPDRVDADLVAERLEHVEVRVHLARDPLAVAEELAGERECSAPLPHPGRPMEEVRVGRSLRKRRAEQALGLVLLRKGLEALHG
jgi:hypothetical protein